MARVKAPPAFPALVCAWCGVVIHEGTLPVSHGMCPACAFEFAKAASRARDA